MALKEGLALLSSLFVTALGGVLSLWIWNLIRKRTAEYKIDSVSMVFLRVAVLMLPADERGELQQDWFADMCFFSSAIRRLKFSSALPWAACSIRAARFHRNKTIHFAAKRLFDLVYASVSVVVLSPILGAVALLIMCESSESALIKKRAWGKNQKIIRVAWFRTRSSHGQFEPTLVGRWLEASGLVSLPNLFSVIKGDISLVGPRVHEIDLAVGGKDKYRDLVENYHERHGVKPGITGLAQSIGLRGDVLSEAEARFRIEKDIEYKDNYSFVSDLKIIWRTMSFWLHRD